MAESNSIAGSISGLQIGQSCSFGIEKVMSVRTIASALGMQQKRFYSTKADRAKGIVTVTRKS